MANFVYILVYVASSLLQQKNKNIDYKLKELSLPLLKKTMNISTTQDILNQKFCYFSDQLSE